MRQEFEILSSFTVGDKPHVVVRMKTLDDSKKLSKLIEAAPSMFTALTELIEIRQQRMISGDTRELMEKEAEAYNKAYVAIEKAVPKVTYEIPAYPSDY